MSVFIAILPEPDTEQLETVTANLVKHYPSHHWLNDNVFLVSSDELAKEVKEKIGIGEEGADGIVFRLNHAYSGYTSRDTWEWLSKAEQTA